MSCKPSISKQLRDRRVSLGLSLSDVARRAGTSAASLSRYEGGWTRFGVYTLRKLASALGCDLEITLRPRSAPRRPRVARDVLVRRLQRLFWDHELRESDLDEHLAWVFERVLEYGNMEDIRALELSLGRKAFLDAVSRASRLSPKTLSFWRQILEKEGISCTKRYSPQTAWNS